MNALFSMPGGKAFQKKLIVPKFPAHKIYIEPFVGAGSIFFHKEPSEVEIINDKDEGIASFYKYIQTHSTPPQMPFAYCTREQFLKWKDLQPKNDEERFIKQFIVQQCSFRGNRRTYKPSNGKGGTRPYNLKLNNFLSAYPEYHQRLKGVTILNKDFREVISQYDSSDSFTYLDPPYETGDVHDVTVAAYEDDWYGRVKLDDIKETVEGMKGKWMISFSENKKFIEMMSAYNIEKYETRKVQLRPAA